MQLYTAEHIMLIFAAQQCVTSGFSEEVAEKVGKWTKGKSSKTNEKY